MAAIAATPTPPTTTAKAAGAKTGMEVMDWFGENVEKPGLIDLTLRRVTKGISISSKGAEHVVITRLGFGVATKATDGSWKIRSVRPSDQSKLDPNQAEAAMMKMMTKTSAQLAKETISFRSAPGFKGFT